MIGMVLVTHGRLAIELLSVVELIVGPQPRTATVCIDPDDDMEIKRAEILAAIGSTDAGKGVVVLTDMFGGTPSNLAISFLDKAQIEVVAGVNLPMLIKLASARKTEKLSDAALSAQEAGRKYITIASQLLARDQKIT